MNTDTQATLTEHECGAYPLTTVCPFCDENTARRSHPGQVQGWHYVCQNDDCARWSVVIDWCECDDA